MSLLNSEILEFHPDMVYEVRKLYNLEQPKTIEGVLQTLEEWVKKQNHFVKKDIERIYLESALISSKGSIEKAKSKIDKLCTLRTLLPVYFGDFDVKTDLKGIKNIIGGVLTQSTKNFERVYVLKYAGKTFDSVQFLNFYRKQIILGEYLRRYDYMNGCHVVFDITEANVLNLVSNLNPVEIRQILTILIEGYGLRLCGLHILSKSKAIDVFVNLLKQVTSAKIGSRIHSHEHYESLYEHIPKDILPGEYGGEGLSLEKLHDKWLDALSAPKFRKLLKEMSEAKTDESKRLTNKFTEDYLGMPGSFKKLSVD